MYHSLSRPGPVACSGSAGRKKARTVTNNFILGSSNTSGICHAIAIAPSRTVLLFIDFCRQSPRYNPIFHINSSSGRSGVHLRLYSVFRHERELRPRTPTLIQRNVNSTTHSEKKKQIFCFSKRLQSSFIAPDYGERRNVRSLILRTQILPFAG